MELQTSVQKKWSGQTRQLQRHLGLPEAIVLGVSSPLGGSIFVLVGLAIGEAGLGILFSFTLALIATIVVALPYTELACYYPQAGGISTFVQQTLGDQWGFVAGWISFSSYLGVAASIGIGFGDYLHTLLPLPPLVGGMLLFIAITLFNVYSIHFLDRLLTLIVFLTLMSLLALILGGLLSLHSPVLLPVLPHGFSGIMNAAPLAFLALSGFDVLAAKGAMRVIGFLVAGTLTMYPRAGRLCAHPLGDCVPTSWAIFPSVFPLLSATLTSKTCLHLRREKKERFL